jgi:hypothetical protein
MSDYKVKHLKRGTTYTVIGRAELQSGFDCAEGQCLVVYQGVDGKLWARPEQEFHDGRFVTQEVRDDQ